ncbi:fucose 4-O-acetylase-like acetyltransferase [Agromyces aurantiacus]|nr:fucose 4-O-acetylase-like acetyltransferase [Agromyces aurantiacus]
MVQQVARRDASVDVVRILAIVAVVAGHVWFEPAVRLATYTWHVPVFFVLSGYLSSGRPARLGSVLGRRARSLLVPYAAWLLILGLALGAVDQPLRLLAGGTALPRGFTAFWFVTAFFVAVAGAAVLDRMPLAGQWGVALLLLAAGGIAGRALADVPLDAAVGLACVVFVVAGRTLRAVRDHLARPVRTGAAMLALAAVLIASGASAPLDLKQGDFGTPVVSVVSAILVSCGLILVARGAVDRALSRLGDRAAERTGALVSRLALCGFAVVLTHAAVLLVMRRLEAAPWLAFAVALVVTWSAAMVLLVTPLAPILCGVPRQRASAGNAPDPKGERLASGLEAHARGIREPAAHDLDRVGVLVDEHEAAPEPAGHRAGRA